MVLMPTLFPAPVAPAATPTWEDDAAEAAESMVVQSAPVAEAKPSSQRAEDILAMIRNRQK